MAPGASPHACPPPQSCQLSMRVALLSRFLRASKEACRPVLLTWASQQLLRAMPASHFCSLAMIIAAAAKISPLADGCPWPYHRRIQGHGERLHCRRVCHVCRFFLRSACRAKFGPTPPRLRFSLSSSSPRHLVTSQPHPTTSHHIPPHLTTSHHTPPHPTTSLPNPTPPHSTTGHDFPLSADVFPLIHPSATPCVAAA